MVLPGNIPKFSLNLTPQKISSITQEVINLLQNSIKEIIELSEKNENKLDLLKKWHQIEGIAAAKQTYCTLPSLVHKDSNVREESAQAKKKLKDTWNSCYSHEKLYNIFKSISSVEDPLEQRLLDKTLNLFKRNGLDLPKEKRANFQDLQRKITELENKFIQNINEDVTTLTFTRQELDGCSENFLKGLKKKIEIVNGKEIEKLNVTLKPPELQSLLQNANIEETRKIVLTAAHSKCKSKNLPLFKELLNTRQKLAQELGYDCHANYMLSQNMVKNLNNANKFLNQIVNPLRPMLDKELENLLSIKKQECEKNSWKYDNKLNLWDISYYEKILKDRKYSMNEEKISCYFPIEILIKRILELYQEILHLKFEKVQTELWHNEAIMYSVYDNHNLKKGEKGEILGYMILDIFPRDGKYSHQCVIPLAPSFLDENNVQNVPVVVIIGNLTKSTEDTTALLKHSEVRTFFHEFGHVMHAICTHSKYSRFSWSWTAIPYPVGIEMDSLEVPSQMFENWIWDPKVLKRLSHHYETGESFTDELIDSICSTRHINLAYKYSRQIFMSLYDLKVHGCLNENEDILKIWEEMQFKYTGLNSIPDTVFFCSWYHLAMGYDAGYYSYLWSEAYSHDLYTRFKKSDEGCMDNKIGYEYRKTILEPGANVEFIESMRKFLSRDPNNEAFLKYIGIEEYEKK